MFSWQEQYLTSELHSLLRYCSCHSNIKLGSLSKRTFQGDAMVKSEKARDSRHHSRTKFNLLSTGATRLGVLHSQILAYLIPLSLLWHVLKSFVRFFSYYDASLISDEDYCNLLRVVIFMNPNFAYESDRFDLDEMNDDECKAKFGIRKCHTCETSLFITEIKFNLRFKGFRPNGFRCTCVCVAQWSFHPDRSKQLSLPKLFKKVSGASIEIDQPEEEGEQTIKTLRSA